MSYKIAALYRFVTFEDAAATQSALKATLADIGVRGTLLVAPEGLNGTLAGTEDQITAMLAVLEGVGEISKGEVKFSYSDEMPFNRLKVRLKREIITFNQPQADPNIQVGAYVEPKDWNALLADPDVVLLDTRNVYETMVGTFKGAVDPSIEKFTDFASFVRETLDPQKNKKIAMFCTGGIRCEKASSFMLAEGFEEVYHLKGGILKYLEETPEAESLWQGDCYVFDRRMAVGHGLTTGKHSMCYSCGYALTAEDYASPLYEEGVACTHCHGKTSDADKARFRMRHMQMMAAEQAAELAAEQAEAAI